MEAMSYTSELKPRHVLTVELSGDETPAQRATALRRIADAVEQGQSNGSVSIDAVHGTWINRRAWKM